MSYICFNISLSPLLIQLQHFLHLCQAWFTPGMKVHGIGLEVQTCEMTLAYMLYHLSAIWSQFQMGG